MNSPVYPLAIQQPLTPQHFSLGALSQRSKVVLHITEGTTASGAISTFAYSKPKPEGSGLVSAHFVIDRDGTIYQLVSIDNTAYHASQINYHSIGVEHVALSAAGAASLNKIYAARIAAGTQKPWAEMLATDAQYAASAKLLCWLCGLMKVPVTRQNILTHHEASPNDHHDLCCTGGLNPDRLVELAVKGLPS